MATKSILTETDNRLENIEISKISDELFDFRDKQHEAEDKTSEEFQQLKLSIQNEGVLTPIHVSPDKKKSGNYLLVDGRRRFNAIKQLGIKTIPAIIVTGKTANDLAVITLIQNIHRKDLKGEEKNKAIIKLFEMNGFNSGQILNHTNSIYTRFFSKKSESIKVSIKEDILSKEEKTFKNLLDRTGISIAYFRLLMYSYHNLDPEIYKETEKAELDINKKTLLVHPTLKKHPKITKGLVSQLKELPNYTDAKAWRDQTVRNLESGALKVDKDVNRYVAEPKKREDITKEPKTVPTAVKQYLAMLRTTNAFLKVFTDDAKSKSKEKNYSREHIKYSESFRKEIIDNLEEEESKALAQNMILSRLVADSILNLVNRKYRTEF